jgi:hypothetical protein
VVSFTPRPLYPRGKSPRYPLVRKLGGPQSRSGISGEENILDPTGTGTANPSVVQPVASRYTDYAIPAPKLNDSTFTKAINKVLSISTIERSTLAQEIMFLTCIRKVPNSNVGRGADILRFLTSRI